ncbi:hypothetical protein Nepgr_033728 [Nepenthes gracilis]|uniref:Uncharacterized protein n=1 Tax=Nepenthes gracilis TaxID=150966 RepID=A0AAD3TMC1_NEPGR|nr:hypothetical protein Nepgr_033728 [Nepenthes gracilis]
MASPIDFAEDEGPPIRGRVKDLIRNIGNVSEEVSRMRKALLDPTPPVPPAEAFGDEGGGSKDSLHVHLVAEANQEASACFEPTASESGTDGLMECSTNRGLAATVQQDSILGSTVVHSDNARSSQCSLEDSDGAHLVLDSSCPMDQTERSQVEAKSVADCLVNGIDVSTPDSIVRISRKYSLVESAHGVPSSENKHGARVGSQEGVAAAMTTEVDPMFQAIQQHLDRSDTAEVGVQSAPELVVRVATAGPAAVADNAVLFLWTQLMLVCSEPEDGISTYAGCNAELFAAPEVLCA